MVIRYLGHSIDSTWTPKLTSNNKWGSEGTRWYANISVRIADETGKEVGDYYGLIVVSPGFQTKPAKKIDVNASYVFVMNKYNDENIETEIKRRLNNISGNSWSKISEQLSQYFWVD